MSRKPAIRRALPLVGLLVGALVLAVLATACAQDPATTVADDELPQWVSRVYPPPGAEVATNAEIQVEHNLTAPDEQIRLSVDGTDVTVYSDLDNAELVYDMEDPRSPVVLDPGTHTATIERTRVPEDFDIGVDQVEVLGVFEWEFTVQ